MSFAAASISFSRKGLIFSFALAWLVVACVTSNVYFWIWDSLDCKFSLDFSKDSSDAGTEDVDGANLSFIYPPRENKPTLLDGFSDEVWFEESMQNKLSEKVERNNNLTVEIQGAVIFTKK